MALNIGKIDEIRKLDQSRSLLFEDVANDMREICLERDKLRARLEQAEDLRDRYFDDLKRSRANMQEIQTKISANLFCLVLVDADNTLFCDDYVKRGAPGGREAAKHFHGHLMKLLRTHDDWSPHMKVIVRLYANISELGEAYVRNKIIHHASVWSSFVQGFNKELLFCEFVDSGNDKESTDMRITETINLFSDNVHCKKIVLAISGDKGYAGYLRKFAPIDGVSDYVTLIEARPFPPKLKQVARSFRCEQFPTIFRSQDLASSLFTSDTQLPKSHNSTTSGHQPVTHELSFSSVVASIDRAANATKGKIPTASVVQKMHFNTSGHRLDAKLQYQKQLIVPLRERKLCLSFFFATCSLEFCKYDHKSKLNTVELDTLRYIARLNPCRTSTCRRPFCFYGHVCPYDGTCDLGKSCKFPADMHRVDVKVDMNRTIEVVDF